MTPSIVRETLEFYLKERSEFNETLYAHILAAECAAEVIIDCLAKCRDDLNMVKVIWDAKKMLIESLEVAAIMCAIDVAFGDGRAKKIVDSPQGCLSILMEPLLFDFYFADMVNRRREIDIDALQEYIEETLMPHLNEIFRKFREVYNAPSLDDYIKPPGKDIKALAGNKTYLDRVASVLEWPLKCPTIRKYLDEMERIVEEHAGEDSGGRH